MFWYILNGKRTCEFFLEPNDYDYHVHGAEVAVYITINAMYQACHSQLCLETSQLIECTWKGWNCFTSGIGVVLMELLLSANVCLFSFFFESGNIPCVNTTLERHHVTQDFVLERLEQLERRPMHESCRNSFTLYLKGIFLGANRTVKLWKSIVLESKLKKQYFFNRHEIAQTCATRDTAYICVNTRNNPLNPLMAC